MDQKFHRQSLAKKKATGGKCNPRRRNSATGPPAQKHTIAAAGSLATLEISAVTPIFVAARGEVAGIL
jgi:hypothetical protein